MKMPKIPIIEIFGPTIQGEGIMSGTVTHFLRTGGCGLRCEWCDSMYAVLPSEIKKNRTMMTTAEILNAIDGMPWAPYITFTGGDPCLQKHLGDIIPALNNIGMRVAVETQGQVFPDWLAKCDVLTFSPKGPSSGNIVDIEDLTRYCIDLGVRRPQQVCIKVVVFGEADFEYAMSVYNKIPQTYYDAFYFTAGTPMGLSSPLERSSAVLMNESALAGLMLEASKVTRYNEKVHLGCQMHVLLWPGEERGV